mgnify:CR=1 FL=1|jgi:hypothetical protein
MNIKALVIFLCIGLAGCSTVSPGGYYWGKYSYTYHDLLKAPGEATIAAHEATLQDIITKSKEKNLRTPPGIHAELGNLLSNAGRNDEAVAQFQAERDLYPESAVFLQRLLVKQKPGVEK